MKRHDRTARNESLRKQIGLRIKEFRLNKGLTQGQLAESVDVTEKHLSQIEQGVSFPSIAVLMDLATTLEQPVEALLYGTGEAHSDAWKYIDSVFSALSEDARVSLHRIATELLDLEQRVRQTPNNKN